MAVLHLVKPDGNYLCGQKYGAGSWIDCADCKAAAVDAAALRAVAIVARSLSHVAVAADAETVEVPAELVRKLAQLANDALKDS